MVSVSVSMVLLLISQADGKDTIAMPRQPFGRWTELSGLVNDDLSAQHIHTTAFHRGIKGLLAAMVSDGQVASKRVAVVVGVEYGMEIEVFLNMGFSSVVGFEADRHRYPHLEQMSVRTGGRAHVHLCGASDQPGKMNITYGNEVFEACLVRIDDYVSTSVSVLSVDIQGQEGMALRGAKRLVHQHGVDMMWVEIDPDTCEPITELLHGMGYILWDRVWAGTVRPSATHVFNRSLSPFEWELDAAHLSAATFPTRSIQSYCARAREIHSRGLFQWLQTDIIAIHSSAMRRSYVQIMKTFHEWCGSHVECLPAGNRRTAGNTYKEHHAKHNLHHYDYMQKKPWEQYEYTLD